jgi:predicted O-linked N-acetylglucosamine transferase (SPINDLY family)
MFDIWMRLLLKTPRSVLWLSGGEAVTVTNLRREAVARGVSPERLVFAPKLPAIDAHLARYRQADLFLDTVPYGAHATARDALWAGLPVLTCVGDAFASRVAGSLLAALDLPEFITHSLEEYERRALDLSRQPSVLGELRRRLALARNSHPLFDTRRFCRHLEAAYLQMWERYLLGLEPVSFTVDASVNHERQ